MKLYGEAYNRIETNSSIEMAHLTGWIPETVKFGDVSNKENLWTRMKQNYKDGNIILAIGAESKQRTHDFAMIRDTSFAVLEIKEINQMKLLKCKNPSKKFNFTFATFNSDSDKSRDKIEDSPMKEQIIPGKKRDHH